MGWGLTAPCWVMSRGRSGLSAVRAGMNLSVSMGHIIVSAAGTDNLVSICSVMDASDGRAAQLSWLLTTYSILMPVAPLLLAVKIRSQQWLSCLSHPLAVLLGVQPCAARAVLVLSQGGKWISSLLPNVLSLTTKPESVKKDPCPARPWCAPWVVQSLTREAGGHRGSFPLKLIIRIHVDTVCACHCIFFSLCDFGTLGSLRFLIFLGYQFFQFLALRSCTI